MADTLLIAATAPVLETPDGFRLDVKFVNGMRAHARHWPGRVRCLLRRSARDVPFGASYDPRELGFELALADPQAAPDPAIMTDICAVFAALDDISNAALLPLARRAGAAVVYSLEYTLATRLQIARLDPERSWPRKLNSMIWNLRQEHRRRAAVRAADGLQCNGFPAHDRYGPMNRNALLFLDNRMTGALMATPAEMEARRARRADGGPLRLIHSGRLEPMKGAQDLLGVMDALRAEGVPATLDIYGTGSLEPKIRAGLGRFGGAVRMHGAVDFETVLVPSARRNGDVFLSCHRQSDPSCSYLEAMGCGLAVAGYDNQMWRRLREVSGAGLCAPLGDTRALARQIARWHADHAALVAAAQTGLIFAREHDFETEFARRMAHLRTIVYDHPIAQRLP